jgi:hypothetical protein
MKWILKIIAVVSIVSCSTTLNFSVKNVQDISSYGSGGTIYSLPHTRIAMTFTAVRRLTVPGPYQLFAHKLLGIDNVSQIPVTKWDLLTVEVATFSEPDPEYFYLVKSNKTKAIDEILTKIKTAGLIMDTYKLNTTSQSQPVINPEIVSFPFTDLLIEKTHSDEVNKNKDKKIKETKENRYTLPEESSATKEPENEKTLEQKAEIAANNIVKIRKRRLDLVSGGKTYYPEGLALTVGLQELNKIEAEYLSLFIGQVTSDTIKHTYYYIPRAGSDPERNEVCRFSETLGFGDAQSSIGQPVIVELKDLQITGVLDHLQLSIPIAESQNMLYYRVPDNAEVKVYFGSKLLSDCELILFQYGPMVPYSGAGATK